jgi:regulator of sirC expression with transglutaminase-like and TPR domain
MGTSHDDDDDAENADDDDTRIILGELDDLFTLVAARRRGEMLFAEEMSKPDAEIDFVRAAMYVAMHRRPDESRVEDAVEELDELAAELEKLLPPKEERFPLRTLKAISRYMFETLGFEGNQEEFYDPRNSCLDEVLARRKGIPITLSLVYMEVRSYYLLHWSPYDGVGVVNADP